MDSIWFFLLYEHVNQNRWHHLIFLNCTSNRVQSTKWMYSIKIEHSPGYHVCRLPPTAPSSESFSQCDLATHLHQLCGWKKNGSLHTDKRTFTANTAIKKSLSSSGLKCPEEACTCSVWVPEAERLTKQHQLHQQPPGTRLRIQSDRRKWLKATDGGDMRPWKRLFSTLLAFNWNILEPPVPGPKNRASQQKTQW